MIRAVLMGTGGSAGVPHIGGADGHGDWGACDPQEPRNRRTRSSLLVSQGSATLLVDTPPDLRAQLLASGTARVDAILFTHAHADHILGLDDVRMLNRNIGRPIEAFATEATLSELKRRFDYAFRPWEPPGFYRPVLIEHVVTPGQTVHASGMRVQVFDQDHGYSRSLGMRIGGFAYSTDVVGLDEAAFATLEGVDTWVVACFQRQRHRCHAWIDQVLSWVERVQPRRTVLTHMGQDMDWAWLVEHLPAGIEPGYDGMVIDAPA
ncbi:MBL fold metallo-hydrolase [Rhodovastum atsumiense]|uniref:MBL fold metallo-hydrolase n=1 Tax=Rhodovastum atsumiense TaxID=504468 RepID=UPI001EEFC9D1|nr:MBL fold metallo-hydrolase [Rhodovastum atsumiense]